MRNTDIILMLIRLEDYISLLLEFYHVLNIAHFKFLYNRIGKKWLLRSDINDY